MNSCSSFTNPNQDIKNLFNYNLLPSILKIVLGHGLNPKSPPDKIDFILCDNKINTVLSILENKDGILTDYELNKINFI